MEKDKVCLLITLPANLTELPIRVVRGDNQELLCSLVNTDDPIQTIDSCEKKFVFVWSHGAYVRLSMSEIIWLEADGSYTTLHLTGKRKMVLSFSMASALRILPVPDFVRIHRSFVVNVRHIIYMIGNSLKINDQMLPIGREYRKNFLDHFIFLGVRHPPE